MNNMHSSGDRTNVESGVLLLYSGGMDSIAGAILLAEQFASVRLLTCSSPYILGCRYLTGPSVQALRRRFPEVEISQLFADHIHLLRRLRPLGAVARARSSMLFCTACKLAMHLKAIEVCLREGIGWASSGSGVVEQQDFPDQFPALEKRIDKLYNGSGIRRLAPLYGYSKSEVKDLLARYDLPPKFRYPRCMITPVQGICWLFRGPPAKEPLLNWYDGVLPTLKRIILEAAS